MLGVLSTIVKIWIGLWSQRRNKKQGLLTFQEICCRQKKIALTKKWLLERSCCHQRQLHSIGHERRQLQWNQ